MNLIMRLFRKGGFAIRCRTLEEAKRFTKICEEMGMTDMNDSPLNYYDWNIYEDETCYVNDIIKYEEENIHIEGVNIANSEFYQDVCRLLVVDFEEIEKGEDALIA